MFSGKKILIGISGSIAAYKTILLVRRLVKAGAEVKLVMTPAAKEFVSPLVLETLSKNKVYTGLAEGAEWANHVMLGRWADVMVMAPLSCNTLAKMAHGICDNLLLAVYLSATCPVILAPAMDEDMWKHPATQNNLKTLAAYGNKLIPVNNGELASGLYGDGRMAEPEEIVLFLEENIFRKDILKGKKAVVTAGPTYEAIDPVRFIGNHSSGKMGFAIAEDLYRQGADVTIVTGPVQIQTRYKGIDVIRVQSAKQMFHICESKLAIADICVMAAAVADYTPVSPATQKIKKQEGGLTIELEQTNDILRFAGANKKAGQFLAGFALETEHEKENAIKKLKSKNADCIILNSLRNSQAGFGVDTNEVTILDRWGGETLISLADKKEVAAQIVSYIISKMNA